MNTTDAVRVVVVDDHRVVRAGLETLLSSAEDIDVVGSAADGREAVAMILDRSPDVVLMDLSMPGMDGIEATRQLTAAGCAARIVVLTSFNEQSKVVAAVEAGAVGYILKDAEPERLLDAIRAAASGGAPLDPRAATALLAPRSQAPVATDLTPRELDVLRLVAEGLASKQIARRLDISEKTVKAHLTHVYQRLGVSDRTQAALWAQRNGIGPV
jgi:DNA-binding NarL/FixJ family response regulator